MTADECRAKAEELELTTQVVSYGPDRVRRSEQARFWRPEEAKTRAFEAKRRAA
ncbi:MAG: hypothetical protein V4759_05670 [Pseudomonadota bacterium]